MAEWVRSFDWRPDGLRFESHCGKTFRFGTLAILFTPLCQCLSDTKSHRALLSGVYARGSKRSHQSALECVTAVDSTAHSELPQKCVYAAENAALHWKSRSISIPEKGWFHVKSITFALSRTTHLRFCSTFACQFTSMIEATVPNFRKIGQHIFNNLIDRKWWPFENFSCALWMLINLVVVFPF